MEQEDYHKHVIFFKADNDPIKQKLLVNKNQTRRNNLLRYERPVVIGYERPDHNSVRVSS